MEEQNMDEIINEMGKDSKRTYIKKYSIKVLKSLRFWRISLVFMLMYFLISFAKGIGLNHAKSLGIRGGAYSFMVFSSSIILLILGPFIGCYADKKSIFLVLKITTFITPIAGIFLIIFYKNETLFIICYILITLSFTGYNVSFLPFIVRIYGIQQSVILYGIINFFNYLINIITYVSADKIYSKYDKNKIPTNELRIMFIIGTILSIISVVLVLFEKNDKFEFNEEDSNLGNIIEKDEESRENI